MPTGHYIRTKKPIRNIIFMIGPSIAYVPLTRGLFALIDLDDANYVGGYNWCAQGPMRNGSFYAVRFHEASKTVGLHVDLVRPRDGFVADHRNGNTLDHRRTNIREASKAQNLRNTRKPVTNTSGLKGVSLHGKTGKWRAQIVTDGKHRSLGLYPTKELAYEVYCRAAQEFHGEFARVA